MRVTDRKFPRTGAKWQGEDPSRHPQAPGGLAEVGPSRNQRPARRRNPAHVPAGSAARAPRRRGRRGRVAAAVARAPPPWLGRRHGRGCLARGSPGARVRVRGTGLRRARGRPPCARGSPRPQDGAGARCTCDPRPRAAPHGGARAAPRCPWSPPPLLRCPDPVSSGSKKNRLGLNVDPGGRLEPITDTNAKQCVPKDVLSQPRHAGCSSLRNISGGKLLYLQLSRRLGRPGRHF